LFGYSFNLYLTYQLRLLDFQELIFLISPVQFVQLQSFLFKEANMKEFVLLFRHPDFTGLSKASPHEMQALQEKWQDWIASIRSQNKLGDVGMRLHMEGKVLKPNGIIVDGPFAETKEMLGSFVVVKAENIDDAASLGRNCPILESGGSVEIRPILQV
jgi:hypothetical protein